MIKSKSVIKQLSKNKKSIKIKWNDSKISSPSFACPYCEKEVTGLPYDADEDKCEFCDGKCFGEEGAECVNYDCYGYCVAEGVGWMKMA